MKLAAPLFSIACLLLSFSAQAQLYKSVGANGKVTYSDTPPATGKVTPHNLMGDNNDGDTNGLPYELAQAAKNMPVILYSADKCAPCDQGRQFLQSRSIPFSEKTVSSDGDIKRLHEVSSNNNAQVPLLLIGRNKENGFSASNWGAALNAAGYPQNSQLPKGYRNAQVSTAAAMPTAPTTTKNTADNHKARTSANNNGKLAPAAGNAPPGFQF